jgi:hypothetical protein
MRTTYFDGIIIMVRIIIIIKLAIGDYILLTILTYD